MMRVWKCARKVGREVNVPHTTVSRWWTRWCAGEGPGRRDGSGRPRKTTSRTDRKLVIACKRNRFEPVPKLTVAWNFGSGADCSVRTAYRRLAKAGIQSYRPAVRIPLSPTHRTVRKQWCRDHLTWTQEQWRSVLWSDESRFTLDFHNAMVAFTSTDFQGRDSLLVASRSTIDMAVEASWFGRRFGMVNVMLWLSLTVP